MKKIIIVLFCFISLSLGFTDSEEIDWQFLHQLESKYDYVDSFNDGLALVSIGAEHNDEQGWVGGKWGVIDKTGKVVIPIIYDYGKLSFNGFSDGYICVESDISPYKYGYLDKTGKLSVPFKYRNAYSFHEGLAQVQDYDSYRWGYIDKTGKEIISLKYDHVGNFFEGLATVNLNEKYGFVDKTGKEVVPLKYDYAKRFSEGLAVVAMNVGFSHDGNYGGEWGFIDKSGKEIIPLKYDMAESFSEGLAAVFTGINPYGKEERIGFIDKTGKIVIPIIYQRIDDNGRAIFTLLDGFKDGYVEIAFKGKSGYIDKQGNFYEEKPNR